MVVGSSGLRNNVHRQSFFGKLNVERIRGYGVIEVIDFH